MVDPEAIVEEEVDGSSTPPEKSEGSAESKSTTPASAVAGSESAVCLRGLETLGFLGGLSGLGGFSRKTL